MGQLKPITADIVLYELNALADSTKPAVLGPNYITTTVYMTQVCEFLKDLSISQTFRLSVCSSVCLSLTKLDFSAFM